jgi:carboxylesterase
MGLSMGGCLALRLAELHGTAIRGLVLVNPSVTADSPVQVAAARALKYLVPSVKGIASDIKKPGAAEAGYDRMPVKAVASLAGLWQTTQQHLSELTQPVLVFHSKTDHVVGPASLSVLTRALPASQIEVRELADSYHVATLDNDAEAIFAGSLDFVRVHTRVGRASTGEASRESIGGE